MSTPEYKFNIRPRFKDQVTLTTAEIKEKIKLAFVDDDTCVGTVIDNHVILKIPNAQQHYWSPQLTLALEALDNGSLIRGLYGPKPAVWTMFVFFYSFIGFLTMLGLIFGLSQMMLKMNPWGLWSVPVGGVLLAGLFLISKIGQRLGQEQMHQLKEFLEKIIH